MKMKYSLMILFFLLGISTLSFSQKDNKEVRKQLRVGNKEYKKERYTESEITYRKALEVNPRSTDAAYNLGNSLYKQAKFPEAAKQYEATIQEEKDKEKLSMAWHNTGNVFMSGKDYAKSVEAYKQALRNNPNDDETRYNLALAQKLLQDQQDQQKQDQDKDKDKDKDKDQNKDKDKDKDKDQQKDQQKDQKQDQDQKKDQQQNQDQMSKQNAQQILDAMMQNEKNTQEKVKAQQAQQQQQRKTEKNW